MEFSRQWCGRWTQWCGRRQQNMCIRTPLFCVRMFEQFFCHLFTACNSDEHILQYWCCYHTIYIFIYIWLVTAVCLYIYTLLAYNRVLEKCFWGRKESWDFFIAKRVGNLWPVFFFRVCVCVCVHVCICMPGWNHSVTSFPVDFWFVYSLECVCCSDFCSCYLRVRSLSFAVYTERLSSKLPRVLLCLCSLVAVHALQAVSVRLWVPVDHRLCQGLWLCLWLLSPATGAHRTSGRDVPTRHSSCGLIDDVPPSRQSAAYPRQFRRQPSAGNPTTHSCWPNRRWQHWANRAAAVPMVAARPLRRTARSRRTSKCVSFTAAAIARSRTTLSWLGDREPPWWPALSWYLDTAMRGW